MIISQHIRDLFAQHSDIMLPLLADDPAAVEAFTSIVMGGDPTLRSTLLPTVNQGSFLVWKAVFAVDMVAAVPTEIREGRPSSKRKTWEEQAINAVNEMLRRYDHLPAHT
jgi:hypothetical protein